MAGIKRVIRRIDTVLLRLLLLAGTPIFIIATASVLVFSFRTLPALYEEAESRVKAANYSSAITIATWLSEHRQRLRYVATSPAARQEDYPALLSETRRMTDAFDDFVAIVFADMGGRVLVDSIHGFGGGFVGDRGYFRAARAGQSIVGDLLRGRPNDQYFIMIAEPVRGPYQSVTGVVFAPVKPNALEAVIQTSRSDLSGSVYIIDSRNYIVTGSGLGEQIGTPALPPIGASARYTNYAGNLVLGHRTFIPGTRWTLVTERPFASVAESIRRYNRFVSAAAIVVLILSVIGAAAIASTIQNPIRLLDHIARLVGMGAFARARDAPFDRSAPRELLRLHRVLIDTSDQLEHRQNELKNSTRILEATQQMARLGSWEYDPVRHRFFCSREVYRIVGVPQQEEGCSIDGVLSVVHPDDRRALKHAFFRSVRNHDSEFAVDHRITAADDGTVRVVHQRCIHTFDTEGTLLRTRGMVHDITDRHRIEESLREALADKSVLLQEVHHRVRNNLAIVESLLTLKLSQLPEHSHAWEAIAQSRSRISSIAIVHDQLYQRENVSEIDMPDYVQQIVSNVRDSYDSPDIEVTTDLDPIQLDMTRCIPCGMILNELLVNSYRHAFPDGIGHIRVRMVQDEDKTVVLTVADDGIGLSRTPSPTGHDASAGDRSGLGSEIVRQLVRQIDGTLMTRQENGTSVSVSFTR